MSGPAMHRRTEGPFVAVTLVAALVLAGCAGVDRDAVPDDAPPTQPGGIPDDHGLSASRVDEVLPSTVAIDGVACGRLARGSGFAVAEDLVVTNAHVIVGIDVIRVHTVDGRELLGTPVAFDAESDLAILQVVGAGLAPLPLAPVVDNGTTGLLVGWSPALVPDPTPFRVDRAVTVRIEAVGGTERVERRSWLLAAEIEVGDSGAALVDPSGAVIGVAFASSTNAPGSGYAVRSSEVEILLAEGTDPDVGIPEC